MISYVVHKNTTSISWDSARITFQIFVFLQFSTFSENWFFSLYFSKFSHSHFFICDRLQMWLNVNLLKFFTYITLYCILLFCFFTFLFKTSHFLSSFWTLLHDWWSNTELLAAIDWTFEWSSVQSGDQKVYTRRGSAPTFDHRISRVPTLHCDYVL